MLLPRGSLTLALSHGKVERGNTGDPQHEQANAQHPAQAPPTSSRSARTRPRRTRCPILVDNEPGVLARIAGLFSGRGYNIDSLTVSETEHAKHLSRFTIVTTGTPMVLAQIKSQLERLVNVHRVVDLTVLGEPLERELALIKVAGKGDKRIEALRMAEIFRANVDRRLDRALRVRADGPHLQDRAVHLHHDGAGPDRGVRAPASPPSPAAPRGCEAAPVLHLHRDTAASNGAQRDGGSDLAWALLGFVVVTLFTPGPNNTMLMSSGLNFGFRRGLPHLWGVALGFAVMVLAVGLGLGAVFQAIPALYTVLKYVGAAYLLYLAWQIATAGAPAIRRRTEHVPAHPHFWRARHSSG